MPPSEHQLFDELRARPAFQMSLVGPRPCLPYEWDTYLPEHQRRFDSRPGLTGLWQVCGKNRTSFAGMVALDIRYAKTQSLKLDLWIMMKTFPVLTAQVREALARRRAQPATSPDGGFLPARHATGAGGGTMFESPSG